MSHKLEDTVDALKRLVLFLLDNIKQVTATAEASRALLEQRGVFSDAQFEATRSLALQKWDETMTAVLSKGVEAASDAELQRLLQTLRLPKQ